MKVTLVVKTPSLFYRGDILSPATAIIADYYAIDLEKLSANGQSFVDAHTSVCL